MAEPESGRGFRCWLRIFALLACGPFANSAWAEAELKSGVYEGLMLAVSPDSDVSGYYRESQGDGVTKTCSFFLAGHGKTKASVVTWSDESFPGMIKAVDGGVVLQIEKGRDHPGCGMVLLPTISKGLALDRVADSNWIGLAVAAAPKTFLFGQPQEDQQGRSYVVAKDVLGIVSARQGWLEVEYVNGDRRTTGWVKEGDVRKVSPPR